jgi:hypothetical protein
MDINALPWLMMHGDRFRYLNASEFHSQGDMKGIREMKGERACAALIILGYDSCALNNSNNRPAMLTPEEHRFL